MVVSFVWGQKHYRIPYAWKKLVAYMLICVVLYGVHHLVANLNWNEWVNRILGLLLFAVFGWFIVNVERKEFQRMPYIGKYFGTARPPQAPPKE